MRKELARVYWKGTQVGQMVEQQWWEFLEGRRQKTGNYRPVSLTLVVGKILEPINMDEIVEYLEDVMSKLDKGEPVFVIYFDFQKIFDKMPDRRLLNKMSSWPKTLDHCDTIIKDALCSTAHEHFGNQTLGYAPSPGKPWMTRMVYSQLKSMSEMSKSGDPDLYRKS
eukprot:g42075.t1